MVEQKDFSKKLKTSPITNKQQNNLMKLVEKIKNKESSGEIDKIIKKQLIKTQNYQYISRTFFDQNISHQKMINQETKTLQNHNIDGVYSNNKIDAVILQRRRIFSQLMIEEEPLLHQTDIKVSYQGDVGEGVVVSGLMNEKRRVEGWIDIKLNHINLEEIQQIYDNKYLVMIENLKREVKEYQSLVLKSQLDYLRKTNRLQLRESRIETLQQKIYIIHKQWKEIKQSRKQVKISKRDQEILNSVTLKIKKFINKDGLKDFDILLIKNSLSDNINSQNLFIKILVNDRVVIKEKIIVRDGRVEINKKLRVFMKTRNAVIHVKIFKFKIFKKLLIDQKIKVNDQEEYDIVFKVPHKGREKALVGSLSMGYQNFYLEESDRDNLEIEDYQLMMSKQEMEREVVKSVRYELFRLQQINQQNYPIPLTEKDIRKNWDYYSELINDIDPNISEHNDIEEKIIEYYSKMMKEREINTEDLIDQFEFKTSQFNISQFFKSLFQQKRRLRPTVKEQQPITINHRQNYDLLICISNALNIPQKFNNSKTTQIGHQIRIIVGEDIYETEVDFTGSNSWFSFHQITILQEIDFVDIYLFQIAKKTQQTSKINVQEVREDEFFLGFIRVNLDSVLVRGKFVGQMRIQIPQLLLGYSDKVDTQQSDSVIMGSSSLNQWYSLHNTQPKLNLNISTEPLLIKQDNISYQIKSPYSPSLTKSIQDITSKYSQLIYADTLDYQSQLLNSFICEVNLPQKIQNLKQRDQYLYLGDLVKRIPLNDRKDNLILSVESIMILNRAKKEDLSYLMASFFNSVKDQKRVGVVYGKDQFGGRVSVVGVWEGENWELWNPGDGRVVKFNFFEEKGILGKKLKISDISHDQLILKNVSKIVMKDEIMISKKINSVSLSDWTLSDKNWIKLSKLIQQFPKPLNKQQINWSPTQPSNRHLENTITDYLKQQIESHRINLKREKLTQKFQNPLLTKWNSKYEDKIYQILNKLHQTVQENDQVKKLIDTHLKGVSRKIQGFTLDYNLFSQEEIWEDIVNTRILNQVSNVEFIMSVKVSNLVCKVLNITIFIGYLINQFQIQ